MFSEPWFERGSFTHTTCELSQSLSLTIPILKRLRLKGILIAGIHYRAVGLGLKRPPLLWNLEACKNALDLAGWQVLQISDACKYARPIKSLYSVKKALEVRGGYLEKCFFLGAKEWCPWLPNPRHPGSKAIHVGGKLVYNMPEPEHEPHGLYEEPDLIVWANECLLCFADE
jgi:hypothetical protein